MATATQSQVRHDIAYQQVLDRDHRNWQDTLVARMTAVLQAQEARAEREPDADVTFRQSLIDLAAISELIADELPAPPIAPNPIRTLTPRHARPT